MHMYDNANQGMDDKLPIEKVFYHSSIGMF